MWFKVDDSFFSNPKTAMLSDGATALWLRSGSWSAQQLTDGFIPARMVPMFRGSDDSVRELCDVGLWERDDERDGYRFHDWSDYQPDGEEVDALRRKRSEAGKRGANSRWKRKTVDENGKNGKTDGKRMANRWQVDGKPMANRWQTDGKPMANRWQTDGKSMANRWQTDGKSMANSCPVPVPVPVPDKKEKEEYSSSFSKETGVKDFGESRECGETDKTLAVEYPNLDLESAWLAFADRHQDETRAIGDWTRQWKGWCQRRANMSGIPPSKRHIHTWQCEHVLQALGRDKETATPDQQACQMAKQLNKEENTK